jgi:hypothetical protein
MSYEILTILNFMEWAIGPSIQFFLGLAALNELNPPTEDDVEDFYLRRGGFMTLKEAWSLNAGQIKRQILEGLKSPHKGTREFALSAYNELVLQGVKFPAKYRKEVSRLTGASTEGIVTPRQTRDPKPGHREKFIPGPKPRARGGNSKPKGKKPWRE